MTAIDLSLREMQSCVSQALSYVSGVADEKLEDRNPIELQEIDQQFKKWKRTSDKDRVKHYYGCSFWRAMYSKSEFRRVNRTTVNAFKQLLLREPQSLNLLMSTDSLVSIGCGPGCDLVAVLMILRVTYRVTAPIRLLGVDQYLEWEEYLTQISAIRYRGVSDIVEFQQLFATSANIDAVEDAHLCVMAYTDAVFHTQSFWEKLKRKFRVILVLDQNKKALVNAIVSAGYTKVRFKHRGFKNFYYWLDLTP